MCSVLKETIKIFFKINIRKYYEQFYANKFNNLEKMDKLLETCSPPKLNQE